MNKLQIQATWHSILHSNKLPGVSFASKRAWRVKDILHVKGSANEVVRCLCCCFCLLAASSEKVSSYASHNTTELKKKRNHNKTIKSKQIATFVASWGARTFACNREGCFPTTSFPLLGTHGPMATFIIRRIFPLLKLFDFIVCEFFKSEESF